MTQGAKRSPPGQSDRHNLRVAEKVLQPGDKKAEATAADEVEEIEPDEETVGSTCTECLEMLSCAFSVFWTTPVRPLQRREGRTDIQSNRLLCLALAHASVFSHGSGLRGS